jgi:hypothetical protein
VTGPDCRRAARLGHLAAHVRDPQV